MFRNSAVSTKAKFIQIVLTECSITHSILNQFSGTLHSRIWKILGRIPSYSGHYHSCLRMLRTALHKITK
jgi:hypothetical protein